MKRAIASTARAAPRQGKVRRAPNRSTDNDVAVLVKIINSAAGTSAGKAKLDAEVLRKDPRSQAERLECNKTTTDMALTEPSPAEIKARLYEDFNKA